MSICCGNWHMLIFFAGACKRGPEKGTTLNRVEESNLRLRAPCTHDFMGRLFK